MDKDPPEQKSVGKDARIDALDRRLKAAKGREDERTEPIAGVEVDANYRMGNRVLADLIGGIGGGAFFGWVIDHFAGTSPWGLIVVMMLGIVVAFRNIMRMTNRPPD